MPPSDFARADIPSVVEQLSSEEAIQLIAGDGQWYTHGIPRLGIPAIKVSDGPNGIRGGRFFMSTPAKCLPSATALGSTWNLELIKRVGQLLASEAKLRAASVLLGPTINIQRSPLGGRSFESFSEDPHLSGWIATAYVSGLQKEGVASCIKHFVANDQENDRMAVDSILSERALREIYLMPFMLAEKHARPWAYMAAYNRVNGVHCSENPKLIKGILRGEWGSNATVMSDWYGTYGLSEPINAGLDLEMPGNDIWRTLDHTRRALVSRKVMLRTIKERATKVLELVQKCAKGAPEVCDGDGQERSVDKPEDIELMRKVASESIVLLKNEGGVLPLQVDKLKNIAIIGPNAKARLVSGGGSASLKPSFFITPYEGIRNALPKEVEILYNEGTNAIRTLPSLDYELVTEDGKRGWMLSWHNMAEDGETILPECLRTDFADETSMFLVDNPLPDGLGDKWALRLRGKLRPREPLVRQFEFGLIVTGRGKLYVSGKLAIDNWTKQRQGTHFFGQGTVEEKGIVDIQLGESPDILVEFSNICGPRDDSPGGFVPHAGLRLGGKDVINPDEAMWAAVECARAADVAVVVVGLNGDSESEGFDRTTLALPSRMNELVEKVAAANPKTVVVVQAGSAVVMPWVNSVPALMHIWYLGNTTGDALADVLFGKVNPSGKLSLTFPRRLEDTPSFGHYSSENGKVRYAEDLFVGYKHYLHRNIEPLFPFGFGLSYTSFEYSGFSISEPSGSSGTDFSFRASVKVTNTGPVPGSEVVQLYVSFPGTSKLTHPPRALKAFVKVHLEPGDSSTVQIVLDKYAVSYWEERVGCWAIDAGVYIAYVAASSTDVKAQATFVISKGFEWSGL